MTSRYSKTPKRIFKQYSLTYYVLGPCCNGTAHVHANYVYKAFDSTTSALVASAETLEALAEKCTFLGYTLQKETQ